MVLSFLMTLLLAFQGQAQSSVCVAKDKNSQNVNYYYAYNASEDELSSIIEDRFYEKGYSKGKTVAYTDTNKKGYGIIVQSFYTSESGKVLLAHGVALGCKSLEEAKKRALENLQKTNPDWKPMATIKVVAEFESK